MLYPSIDEILDIVDSKFILVNIAAQRARELEEHPETLKDMKYTSRNSIGKALEEVHAGVLRIKR
ncbi:MAG: DNA-directed RNA polymerase subunit omega [Culicoidibacterales bacterium]